MALRHANYYTKDMVKGDKRRQIKKKEDEEKPKENENNYHANNRQNTDNIKS